MKNGKIKTSFENRILTIKFFEGASLDVDDLKQM